MAPVTKLAKSLVVGPSLVVTAAGIDLAVETGNRRAARLCHGNGSHPADPHAVAAPAKTLRKHLEKPVTRRRR